MKVYLGIISILVVVFIQSSKNYKDDHKFYGFRSSDSSIVPIEDVEQKYILNYSNSDSNIQSEISGYIDNGINNIESFFEKPFNHQFEVHLFPNRNELDKQWQKDWNMPEFKSQCWMVASGTAMRLDILSPQVWSTEACEHSYENKAKLEKLIYHELVHVYQGQNNPNPDFEGMDKIGWFLEGIAVYASGQLDEERISRAKEALELDKIPAKLENIWSGNYRYATAGSLVYYIDEKYGRKKTFELLAFTSEQQILESLNISQDELLMNWKAFLNNM